MMSYDFDFVMFFYSKLKTSGGPAGGKVYKIKKN